MTTNFSAAAAFQQQQQQQQQEQLEQAVQQLKGKLSGERGGWWFDPSSHNTMPQYCMIEKAGDKPVCCTACSSCSCCCCCSMAAAAEKLVVMCNKWDFHAWA
jgi:hypothetical protein